MKHDSPQGPGSLHPWMRRSLLVRGAAWVSSFTILSGGLVVAQTDALIDSGSAPEPAAAPEPAPAPRAEAPAPEPEPAPRVIEARPESRRSASVERESESPRPSRRSASVERESESPRPSRRSASAERESPRPSRRSASPEPEVQPQRPRRQASDVSETPKLEAPRVSVPSAPRNTIPEGLVDRPPVRGEENIQRSAKFSESGTNNLVDNFGSPGRDRPNVVVTERASGCQTLIRNGQLSEGSCGRSVVRKVDEEPSASRSSGTTRSLRSRDRESLDRGSGQSVAVEREIEARPQGIIPQRARVLDYQNRGIPATERARIRVVPTQVAAYAPQTTVAEYYRSSGGSSSAASSSGQAQPGETALLFPLALPAQITSGFGIRVHPILGTERFHSGTDIAAPQGTPVLAAYPGEVVLAGDTGGYGLMVGIRHENGTQESRYAHLSEIYVRPGDRVQRGDTIGAVGSTGFSTGPHLHFEWLHQMPTGWVAVDAGEHIEHALGNMLASLPPTDVATAAGQSEPELHTEVEFSFPTDAEIAENKAKAGGLTANAAPGANVEAKAPAVSVPPAASPAPLTARSARPSGISRGI
ncbi:M23 family metallopeptidase [Oscillatoria sp. FACHB-1406]|uniref:M23 family metallopeptidase n=1 Tax=Oscillatoria sp. FACHB-1406 TaxID=2692846 RepID=UPI001684ABCF|nr:M23 family metallopeptidase [Oscillatoria sp. FACHB-1406]MBD2576262.1 peptidoglycan DD-metalloendopeptidase family protein [Oscillatoria sp. FACHB-1406]